MKKCKLSIILILLFFSIALHAQSGDPASMVKVKYSKYYNNEKLGEYLGNYNYEVYFGYIKGKNFIVNIFNNKLELKSTLKNKMNKSYAKLNVDNIIIKEGKYIISSHLDNKKLNQTTYFTQGLDLKTFAETKVIPKVKTRGYFSPKTEIDTLIYSLNFDVFLHIYGKKEKGQWGMGISRIGESTDETKMFNFNISDDFDRVHIYESALSYNNGNSLVVITRSFKNIDDAKGQMKLLTNLKSKNISIEQIFDYSYYVSFFDLSDENNLKLVSQKEVKCDKNIFIKTLNVKSLKSNQLLLCGVYSHPHNYNTRGVFSKTFKTDEINEILINESYFLDNEFLEKFLEEDDLKLRQKDVRKGNIYDYYNYKLNDVIVKKDGSMILAMEKYIYYYETGVPKSSVSHDIVRINYTDFSDIYLSYISPKGKITDVVKVPKFQTQANLEFDFYDSFITKNINGHTFIIYANEDKELEGQATKIIINAINDKTKVLEQYVTEVYKYTRKSNVILAENWLNDYILLTKATDKLKTKEKVLMLDFTKVMKRK